MKLKGGGSLSLPPLPSWQYLMLGVDEAEEGSSRVTMNEQEFTLSAGDSLLIPEHVQYLWQREEGTVALFVVQNPEQKRP